MEGPPVWDSTFVSRPGEYVCTSVLLSAFPDTSTRRVKTSLAGGELWRVGGGWRPRSCQCRKLLSQSQSPGGMGEGTDFFSLFPRLLSLPGDPATCQKGDL